MKGSASDLEKAITTVRHLNITMLINNVGGYPLMSRNFKLFTDLDFDAIDGLINMNARFLACIPSLIIPILPRNRPSLIINVSSAAQTGTLWMVVYSGTKGFVTSFSKALTREMKMEGLPIEVVALNLPNVQSNFNGTPVSWQVPTSKTFAKVTLDRLGRAKGQVPLELTPYWSHGLLMGIAGLLPEQIIQKALVDTMRDKEKLFEKGKGKSA